MPFDIRRFQFLLGTPCECQNITYVDEGGNHVAQVVCCQRCFEAGMMMLAAEISEQSAEEASRQLALEMDGVVEPSAPPPTHALPR